MNDALTKALLNLVAACKDAKPGTADALNAWCSIPGFDKLAKEDQQAIVEALDLMPLTIPSR